MTRNWSSPSRRLLSCTRSSSRASARRDPRATRASPASRRRVFGDQKFYVDHHGSDLGIRATLTTPARGQDFIVALRQNNVIIGRATILDGEETSGYITLAPGTVSPGDYFMIDVEQVGTDEPGYTLVVTLWMRVTP